MSNVDEKTIAQLGDIANNIRIDSIKMTTNCKSGHPTSSCSIADMMAVLFFNTMRHDPANPRNPNNDRFVLSKGHASPALYATWKQLGVLKQSDLDSLRKIDSDIEGHPTPRLDFVDVATGSLGQGLSCAAGMAYLGKHIEKAPYRVFCIMGDGESAEGSIWEAMHFASYYKLNNLVALFDINRLGQSQETSIGHDVDVYQKRAEAFGWDAQVIDGHDVKKLAETLQKARSNDGSKPIALICRTLKGKGIPSIEDEENWHGKPLPKDKADSAIEAITKRLSKTTISVQPQLPESQNLQANNQFNKIAIERPSYEKDKPVATRVAYGTALVKLGSASDKIVALDADVKNSTYSIKLMEVYPQRFVECFIAEQNMVGVAVGMSCRKRCIPFVSTFGTFFTRAFDQLRMGAISMANLKCVGSHVGVSIGEDGTSQMGLEDIALFRSLPGSAVFYPSDAVSTERACELAANYDGICYIRTSRPATPIIYEADDKFEIGKCRVVRECQQGAAVIVGGGVTLFEAIKAADTLAKEGINVAVIDVFSVKPVDGETIQKYAEKNNNTVVVVEDHYAQGGIGEAVSAAISTGTKSPPKFVHLCVRELPRSGTGDQLIEMFNIGQSAIVKAVQQLK